MAEYKGITKISGLDVSSASYKVNDRLNSDIWDISSTPRESNLFQVLSQNGWTSYTLGNNYASFLAVPIGSVTSAGEVYFLYENYTSGDNYNFTFNKTGTTGARIMEVRISEVSSLVTITGGGAVDIGALSGAVSTSITASSTNSTIYIGFRKVNGSNTTNLDIGNFRVTKS